MKRNSNLRSPQKTRPNFARVFSEEDEIQLLKAFNKSKRKNPDLTFSSFRFGQFTQGQLCAKLKRLKAKYKLMLETKSNIKTPHHRKIYSISRKIWGPKSDGTSNHVATEEGNSKEISGFDSKNGKDGVDLEKYPFLVESVPEEVKRIGGGLYLEGLRSLGEEKCKELNDRWMLMSIQNGKIETKKSLLLQKQFTLVAEASRNRKTVS